MSKNGNNIRETAVVFKEDLKISHGLLQSIASIFPCILIEYEIEKNEFRVVGGSLLPKLGFGLENMGTQDGKGFPLIDSTDMPFFFGELMKGISLKDGETHSFQMRYLDIHGHPVDFTTAILVNSRDKSGTAVTLLGFAQAIQNNFPTEGSREILELETKLEKSERLNEELEEFTFVAAHDLQEPLRKLMTFGQRLKAASQNQLNEENSDYLNRMIKASENMKKLIDGLLDYSRISKRKEEFAPTDLQAILRQVLIEQGPIIQEKNAGIKIGTLPKLEASPAQMKQLFQHIIENALKFTRIENIPLIEINSAKLLKSEIETLPIDARRSYWKIDIQDNGIGFEEKYAERIFQLLQKLHGKSEYPGSGIGLAICQKIVEAHKGIIIAHGKPGEGSVFTIILPEGQKS